MKNSTMPKMKIVILLALFSIAKIASTQTWPMPGAKWQYCVTDWNGHPGGYFELGLVGDTILNSIVYNAISLTVDSSKASNNTNFMISPIFTRFSNDTVYRFVNNREYIYFVFSGVAGNLYTTFRSAGFGNNWNDSACTAVLPLKVIENDLVTYNNESLRRMVLKDTLFTYLYEPNFGIVHEYTLVERIGVLNALPLINSAEPKGFAGSGCSLPSDWGSYTLGSYSDNTFNIVFQDCLGTGISETKVTQQEIIVYPNPAQAFITIERSKIYTHQQLLYSIYSIMGELLLQEYSGEKPETKIDVSSIPDGNYMVICQYLTEWHRTPDAHA
jgi:hypothetical protein